MTLAGAAALVLGLAFASKDIFEAINEAISSHSSIVLSESAVGYGVCVLIGVILSVVGVPILVVGISLNTKKSLMKKYPYLVQCPHCKASVDTRETLRCDKCDAVLARSGPADSSYEQYIKNKFPKN